MAIDSHFTPAGQHLYSTHRSTKRTRQALINKLTGAGDGAHEISAQQIRRSFVDFEVPQGHSVTSLLSEDSANTGDDIILTCIRS